MKQVIHLVEQGVSWVQVRDKSASDVELISQIEILKEKLRTRSLDCTLLVNDRIQVAIETGVGIHLGQSDIHPVEARKILGSRAVIGWTIHDDVQLINAGIAEAIDYVGVGPIFPTNTKSDTGKILGVERLASVVSTLRIPVVAIGGISAVNIQEVRRAEPWKIAMCAALMDASTIQDFR